MHNFEILRLLTCITVLLAVHCPVLSAECRNWQNLTSQMGVYVPERGTFYLHESDQSEYIQEIQFGPRGVEMIGITGDWSGQGSSSVGVYDPTSSTFHLAMGSPGLYRDFAVQFGESADGDAPVTGDWTGNGIDTVGVYSRHRGEFQLRFSNTPGPPDIVLPFWPPNKAEVPIAGFWDNDNHEHVGTFDPLTNTFSLRSTNDPKDQLRRSFVFGYDSNKWRPLIGRWQLPSLREGVGIYNGNTVFLKFGLSGGAGDNVTVVAPQGAQSGGGVQLVAGVFKPYHCLHNLRTSPPSPVWAKDLIIYNLRLETFIEHSGTSILMAALDRLATLKDLGVTAISLTPVTASVHADDVRAAVLYGPTMPDRVNEQIGTPEDFQKFVSRAHELGIKIFVDTVLHGLDLHSPYLTEGPLMMSQSWFSHTSDGGIVKTFWGTAQFDWTNPDLRAWWIDKVGVNWVRRFGIDGFRMDLEPAIAGTPLWSPMRQAIERETGRQVVLIPELATIGRGYTYDFSQNDYTVSDFLEHRKNVVDVVKTSPDTLYTSSLSNHDSIAYQAKGRLSAFAYGFLLSPFIPTWFMGEEFDARTDRVGGNQNSPLYFNQLHWQDRFDNEQFYNGVKRLISIRNQMKTVIAPMNRPLEDSNIVKVTEYSGTDLEPYAMWEGRTALVVIARAIGKGGKVRIVIPVREMGMTQKNFSVTNLLTDKTMYFGRDTLDSGLWFDVPEGGVAPLKVEALP